jgi:hypothetical protein
MYESMYTGRSISEPRLSAYHVLGRTADKEDGADKIRG